MRDLLEDNGIYVGKGSGSNIARKLHRVVTKYMCDDDDDDESEKQSKSNMHFNEQGDLVTEDGNERQTSSQQDLERQQAKLAEVTAKIEAAQEITAKLEAAHLKNSKSKQGSSSKTPGVCQWMPDSFDAIGITDNEIRRCLADFCKMYKDSDKYSGDRYHFISLKFDTFKDRCRRMSIPYVLWARAFPTMLIDEAEYYYVSELSKEPRTIEELPVYSCQIVHQGPRSRAATANPPR
ncbi:hypothetical protein E4U32_007683 [Claviceps aff. humidiphila group G2b]|nr:hypothetical protein E4U32_007683 [Claviceps aff. humidiphila group G2b]